ncbi:MAG: S8 family peptidase, partial [Bacteroidota bacterium]
ELVAFGQAGTSDAAAMVSGGAILLQEFFQKTQQERASSALIKALLINGAQDVGQPGLDHQTGYGNMNLDASMEMLAKGQFYHDIVSDSTISTYEISVPENIAQLKVSLVWIDPPAPAGSDVVLMNDLDMVLEDPLSRTYFPQVLQTFPHPDSLLLPATEGEDHLNNIEQIIINNPSSGPMQVRIAGSRMATSEQAFALVFHFVENESWIWDFPVNKDNIPYDGESDTYFRWRSTLSAAQGRLEYSLNEGLDWLTIAESVALEKGVYRWTSPDVSGPALARMIVGNEVYLTEPFVISRTPQIAVGLDCADTLQIRWEPVPGATSYRFFSLGDTNLELYQETSGNGIVLQKAEVDLQVFAVQPVFPGGEWGIRSPALSTSLNEGSCYINYSFVITEVEGVGLYLGLGTFYGVDEIRILRLDADGKESQIQVWRPDRLAYYFLDRSVSEGLNEYQIEVRLTNGETLRTEILHAIYLNESAFQLAPNPIVRGDLLRIRSRDFPSEGSTFRVFDQMGRQIWIRELSTDEDRFETSTLEPGIYIYRIDTDTEKMTGKFVVIEK